MEARRRTRYLQVTRRSLAILVLLALLAGACGSDDDPDGTSADGGSDPTGATAATTDLTPSTPAEAPTSAAGPTTTPGESCTPPPETTASTTATTAGSSSTATATTGSTTSTPSTTQTTTTQTTDPQVAGHQQRLTDLGYWLGPVDGRLGSMTAHAVTAFQKAEGLPRTGRLDDVTLERLAIASTPAARSSAGSVLEIDLSRQILLITSGGRVTRIYDIATGSPATPTPAGRFEIYREIDGFRHAPLGTLYRPKYFNGGIALHGYTSVPPEPASHGCVRLTYPAMDDLWASGVAPVGTTVLVY